VAPGDRVHTVRRGPVAGIRLASWARGQAGPYSVIASYITAAQRYGFEPIPIFMLARDDVLVGDDRAKVTFAREGVYTDQATGKPVAATTRYTYQNGEDRYVVSFTRTHDLTAGGNPYNNPYPLRRCDHAAGLPPMARSERDNLRVR
jgi:hypothetical protein